jgi:signal transduction histidine kinase
MKGLPQDRNGISNMEERLAELGGTCQIESFPGEGTQIAFSLPLDDRH